VSKQQKQQKQQGRKVKLRVPGGKAAPSSSIAPKLGGAGVNIMNFCKEFNARSQDRMGELLPVVITVNPDRSFTFEVKEPEVSFLIKQETSLQKGSSNPNREKVGVLSLEAASRIAKRKMKDMGVQLEESALRSVIGTAKSMGIEVEE